MIGPLFKLLFGGGRNVVAETAEVFRINAEAEAERGFGLQGRALEQFAAEFLKGRRTRFDRFMDALNRIPRPAMALGTLALFVTAMLDPVWFAARMSGIALVPEPLWWLLGAIVSFYFGARHQAKGQDFQRDLAATLAAAPDVARRVRQIEDPDAGTEPPAADNPALAEWRAKRG
ncbi:holin family protein [Aestuariicoccus sp. MJ-SS9]|uniref:holin family protein n=1 Tax=Aestuariicoccus sp. MJ-SS9 TaxID=3079855 RepID=UPI00290F9186|nr:holin family protein [Aestuariicoccus sp. MJ-SS9]MDU8911490.1 holin family protein [Aestuariicoccus sp. MJ-SS9]